MYNCSRKSKITEGLGEYSFLWQNLSLSQKPTAGAMMWDYKKGWRGIAMFRRGEIVGNFLSNAFKEKFLIVFRKHAAEKSWVLIRPAQDIHFLKNQTNKKQNHNLTHSYIQQLLQISKSLESVKHLAEPHQNWEQVSSIKHLQRVIQTEACIN